MGSDWDRSINPFDEETENVAQKENKAKDIDEAVRYANESFDKFRASFEKLKNSAEKYAKSNQKIQQNETSRLLEAVEDLIEKLNSKKPDEILESLEKFAEILKNKKTGSKRSFIFERRRTGSLISAMILAAKKLGKFEKK
jgi:acyl-CoA reductase-like NAD-dependent aldehyde dehydrogenase